MIVADEFALLGKPLVCFLLGGPPALGGAGGRWRTSRTSAELAALREEGKIRYVAGSATSRAIS